MGHAELRQGPAGPDRPHRAPGGARPLPQRPGRSPRVNELEIAQRTLELSTAAAPGADVEVAVDRSRLALTRFANSVIHQNVADDTTSVHVRVHLDGRTAAGSSTLTDEAGLAALVGRTAEAAKVAPLDPGWPGLAPPAEPPVTAPIDEPTAEATPDTR